MLNIDTSAATPDSRLAATVGRNTLFGIVCSAAQTGTRLITVPLVISHLGLGGYGIWAAIVATAAYMRFGSAGIKSAFQKYVAEATGNGNFETANKLLSTGSFTMLGVSAVFFIPVAVFSRNLTEIIGVPGEFLSSASASITVLAAIYVVSNFGAAFEAIVMGGHRIDLIKKFTAATSIAEAALLIAVLYCGYGFLAMTLVMATSELVYVFCCYKASRQVVPQMRIQVRSFTKRAFPELIRFAGTYQLINLLEVLYAAILPLVILKFFGAPSAGIFGVASRVVSSALIAQDALILPLLSAGTMVFASGSAERAAAFLAKSFKVTLASALPPLVFVSLFGPTMILAWTGEADPRFRMALWLTALAGLLRALSLLQLILYRASGRALLDSIPQILRIGAILLVALVGRSIGFNGVLAGMAVAEFVGVSFMFFAMASTFEVFRAKTLALDLLRISAATILIIGAGALAAMIPTPWIATDRLNALTKLCEVGLACLVAAFPVLTLTKSVSPDERRTILDTLMSRRRSTLATSE